MEAIIPILKEFGFPIALCAVLLLAIRHQNAALVKAYTDRIGTLEKIVTKQGDKIDTMQTDMVNRTSEYASSLKDIAGRYASATHEVFATLREILPVLRQLVNSINRCQAADHHYPPHDAAPPHAAQLPPDPRERPTDKAQRNG